VLDGVDAIFGMHVFPGLAAGKVAVGSGAMWAALDTFSITIKGKESHAARPHLGRDAIVAAGAAILSLQTIASRQIDPLESVVLSIGTIKGGRKENIVCDAVTMTGTVRTLNPAVREEIPKRMERVLAGVAQSHGAEVQLEYVQGYPALINSEPEGRLVREVAAQVVGEDRVETMRPSLGGEDFAFYLQKIKGCFFRIGSWRPEWGPAPDLHTSHFDVDEDILPIGARLHAAIAKAFLAAGTARERR